ncbi:hypothetical protein PCYB_052210 [Plasmodium cynomolgi strain B]|uniref:Cleavage and polyadenylation specificity factor subunit 2 n=1 Tax=Plasmodium cynomolgi (strain B) TaxID=1120755 RepID=K6UIP8_PLACD|nr:hypothetical protein PCYB_052210 [Plasmodium cynomolgi strain B]GAB65203.1 hypothetical protein PCYB_052210 [Plasmodium cynomolgi strain B]
MILEIVPLYSHRFYSTLLIIKDLDSSNKGCKLSKLLQDGDKEENISVEPNGEGIEEDAEQQPREESPDPNGDNRTSKDQGDPLVRKTYNYDYLNNKEDFYAKEKDKNIYVLINCGWDDQFRTEDVKNVLRVCEYVDVLLITNHGLSFVGCAPLVFQELQKRKKKIPIICHEYVKAYSKYVLLSYFKCTNSSNFFKSFKDDEYFKIVNELFYNVTSLEFREHYTFKKIICQKKNTVCMLPIHFVNNGDNIGSSAVIIKFFNSKILYSVNTHMSDYSFIEKSDVLQQSNVFTYIGNFRYTNKNYAKMVDMKSILGIVNRTMNNLGCVLLPVDIDSVFLDLLFHINALLEVSMQRYALLFLCPYSENFTRLLFASLTYLNSHIKNNFHKNRVNIFKMKNLVCINNYSDFKKYENGYYILFSFPASLNNDTVKKILATFLTRKKNALIFTKRYHPPSFSHKVCSHYFTHRNQRNKPELSFCFSQQVKIDDEKLYEIYLKEKSNIEKDSVLSKVGEMLYIKREGHLIGKTDREGVGRMMRDGTTGGELIKKEKYKRERSPGAHAEEGNEGEVVDDEGDEEVDGEGDDYDENDIDDNDDDDYDYDDDDYDYDDDEDDDEDGDEDHRPHDPQNYNAYYHSDEEEEQEGAGEDPKSPDELYTHSDSNASYGATEKYRSGEPSANHHRDKHDGTYRSDIDEDYSQDGMEPSTGKTRKGRVTIKEEKINNKENAKFFNHLLKNEQSDDPNNTYYPHLHKIGNVNKDTHKKKVRIKEEPEPSDDEIYGHESYTIKHPLSKHRDQKGIVTAFVKNEQVFTSEQEDDLQQNNEENSDTNDERKGTYQTVHISDYYEVNKKKLRAERRVRKGKNMLDRTYKENRHSLETPKMTWKKKLIKYLKIIPTTVQEVDVSIQVDCSVRAFNIENYINQNALNSIIHLMKPQHFVLLPSCNSFLSFHFEMLVHASIQSLDEIKLHSFYIPNFSSSANKRSIYLNRYFCSRGKTLDSVSIPLSVHYENVRIKSIYTMINTTKVADGQLNVFKIKASVSSARGEPSSQLCARRRKRFVNEHSTFWSEFSEANYSLAIDNQNGETQEGEKHTKTKEEKENQESQKQGEQNAPNEISQSGGKEKSNEKKPFLDYYMDDEVASGGATQGEEDQHHAGESSDDSDASSEIRDILSNEDTTNEEHPPSGTIYIGEVTMKNLSLAISSTFQRCLNFTQENQIIIDGKTCVKKEERDIATRGPTGHRKVERTKRNIIWKVQSSLDPSFYFLRNVLKDMYNHVSI